MDFDPKDIAEYLFSAARSVGAEVTSPWFYLQFGLMLVAAGMAYAADATIHARVDMTSLAIRWPLPLRHFVRGVRSLGDHRARRHVPFDLAEPQLSARGRRQAGGGVARHPACDLGHPKRLHRQGGVIFSMVRRRPEHHRPARCNGGRTGFDFGRAGRIAAHTPAP